jgi:hypothetical protein
MCRADVDAGAGLARPMLGRGSPNPFRASIEIAYDLVAAGNVKFEIYNVEGRKIRTLALAGVGAGSHAVVWDGRDDAGRQAPSGVYRARMAEPACGETASLILLR